MTVYTNTKFLPVISRMTFHSSSIPSHIWPLLYVTQLYSYHVLFGELLACHRGISFLQLLHKFTALSCCTAWHSWSSWDKQHHNTGLALCSKWHYFSVAGPNRQLSALCAALSCEVTLVTQSIWFGHMAMGCLVKPGAGLSSPAKEFHSALMLLMGLFIVAPPGLSRHVHSIRAFKTSFVTEWNVTECAAYHRTIICPASLFTHFRSCQSLHRLMNNRVHRRVPSEQ